MHPARHAFGRASGANLTITNTMDPMDHTQLQNEAQILHGTELWLMCSQVLQHVLNSEHQQEPELPSRINTVCQLLRLFCESVRRSLRPETKALHAQLKAARQQGSTADLDTLCRDTITLVQSITEVIDSLQEVSICISS